MEILPIIDEEGNVIGSEERDEAHRKGLLHPGSRVIVKLSDGKIVFQRRSLTKETNPGRLSIAAAGHIKFGQTPEEGAVAELLEETGITADQKELVLLGTKWVNSGAVNGVPHRVLGYYYSYQYQGSLQDFKVEDKEGDGFVTYSLEQLEALTPEEQEKFSAALFTDGMMDMFRKA